MSAGKFDRVITIQAPTTTPDEYGTPQKTWATFWTGYAQLLTLSRQEFMLKELGETTEIVATYRIRYVAGVNLAMRVVHSGQAGSTVYRVADVREIGRHEYLELKCVAVTS
jgi:SPP1 family predicted phage head-tail adaptor